MPQVFADTSYWIARYFPGDQWHRAAMAAERLLGHPLQILTTQEVLTEFLDSVSGNPEMRREGVKAINAILNDSEITVTPQTPQSFARGFQRYQNRMDKGYSLVDCISMNTMDDYGLTQILTSDHHFNQEGQYTALMRQP